MSQPPYGPPSPHPGSYPPPVGPQGAAPGGWAPPPPPTPGGYPPGTPPYAAAPGTPPYAAAPPYAPGTQPTYQPSGPAYGAYPPVPPARSTKSPGARKVGKVLLLVGLVLLVIGIGVGAAATNRLVQQTESLADATPVSGSTTLNLSAGETRMIYYTTGSPRPVCTVRGPGGAVVPSTLTESIEVSGSGGSYRASGRFTASSSGNHTVTCDKPAVVGPAINLADIAGSAGLMFLAFGAGGLGFVLALIGGILWGVNRAA